MTWTATSTLRLSQAQSIRLVEMTAVVACAFGAAILSWQFFRFLVVFPGPALLAVVLGDPAAGGRLRGSAARPPSPSAAVCLVGRRGGVGRHSRRRMRAAGQQGPDRTVVEAVQASARRELVGIASSALLNEEDAQAG